MLLGFLVDGRSMVNMMYYVLLFLLSIQVIAYPQGSKDDTADNSFEDDILGFLDDESYDIDLNEPVEENKDNYETKITPQDKDEYDDNSFEDDIIGFSDESYDVPSNEFLDQNKDPPQAQDYSEDDSFEDDILGFSDDEYDVDSNALVEAGRNEYNQPAKEPNPENEYNQPVRKPNPENYDYKYVPLINGKPIYIPHTSRDESLGVGTDSQNQNPSMYSHYGNAEVLRNEIKDDSLGQVVETEKLYENKNFHGKDSILPSYTNGKYYEHVPSFYDEYKNPIIEVKPSVENIGSYMDTGYDKMDIVGPSETQRPITYENVDNSARDEIPRVVEVLVKKEMPVTQHVIPENDAELPSIVEAVIVKEMPTNRETIKPQEDSESPNVVEVLVNKEISVQDEGDETPVVVESLIRTKPVHHVKPIKNEKLVVKVTPRPVEPTRPVKVTPRPVEPTRPVKVTPRPEELIDEYNSELINKISIPEIDGVKEPLNENLVSNDEETILENKIDDVDLFHPGNSKKQLSFEDGSGLDLNEGVNTLDRRSFLPADPNIWSLMSNVQTQERQKYNKCLTPKNETGNCMPIQMCSVPSIVTNLEDLLKNVCTIDEVFIGLCCPEFPVETVKVEWEQFKEEPKSEAFNDEKMSQVTKECGKLPSSTGETNPWPWMVHLAAVSNDKVFCGGVLINEQYVLTAAHCTTKIPRNQIIVHLEPLDSQQPSSEDLAVVEIKRHAKYNRRTMQNDIALLKLARRVKLGDLRNPVCLPNEDEEYVGETAILLSRNGTSEKGAEESLPVISKQDCQNKLGVLIDDSVLCTLPRTKETTCNDDSGAPLIIGQNNKFKVVGLLTWNRNDCDGRFPSIFTRISTYRRWILNHVK